MNIGILTRRAGFNHGSSLQAYAMATFIRNLGHNVHILNYDEYFSHPLWKLRPLVENIQWRLYKTFPLLLKPFLRSKISYLKIRAAQYRRFKKFEKDFLPLTKYTLQTKQQLFKESKKYDKLVCGSDQIWSPLLFDSNFMFDFMQADMHKTIAYAPSIGVSDISLISKHAISLMKRIYSISCREENGANMISELTERSVPVVIDPTLMVNREDWKKLATTSDIEIDSQYILCYFLGKNIPKEYLKRLSKKLSCKIVNIQMFNRLNDIDADLEIHDIGPCDFLKLINNATWVCTDSFHATIFSYHFKKKFNIFERFKSSDTQNQNSRIHTLVKVLKIGNALKAMDETQYFPFDVDYDESDASLMKWREKSLAYICKSLEK